MGGVFLEKLREKSYCFKTCTEVSLENVLEVIFKFYFLLKEGREWCCLWELPMWMVQARQHSCCRVFKSYDLSYAFTDRVGMVWNCRSSQDCLWKSTTPLWGRGRAYGSSLQSGSGLARVEEWKGAVTCPPHLLSPLKISTYGSEQGSRAQPWPGMALPNQWQLIENSSKESAALPGRDKGPLALS